MTGKLDIQNHLKNAHLILRQKLRERGCEFKGGYDFALRRLISDNEMREVEREADWSLKKYFCHACKCRYGSKNGLVYHLRAGSCD